MKRKKIGIIILIIILLGAGIFGVNYLLKKSVAASNTFIEAVTQTNSDSNIYHLSNTYKSKKEQINNNKKDIDSSNEVYYYNQLTSAEQNIYWQIDYSLHNYDYLVIDLTEYGISYLSSLLDTNGTISILEDLNTSIENAEVAYYYDNPEVYWASFSTFIDTAGTYYIAEFEYYFSANETGYTNEELDNFLTNKSEFDSKLNEITQDIISSTSNLDDWNKALYISKWICDNLVYNKEILNSDYGKNEAILDGCIYSAVVNGSCVCRGYTELYKYLLDSVGIDNQQTPGNVKEANTIELFDYSIELPNNDSGTNINHIWNVVYLNGEYCNIDVTQMDTANESIIYDFSCFGVNDEELKSTHQKECPLDTIECTGTKNSFFKHEGLYSETLNSDIIDTAIQYAIDNGYTYAFMQFENDGDAKKAYNQYMKSSSVLRNKLLQFNNKYDKQITIDEKGSYSASVDAEQEVFYIIL